MGVSTQTKYLKFWRSELGAMISSRLREAQCPIARVALIDTAAVAADVPGVLERLELLQEAVKEAIAKIEALETVGT